MALKYEGMFWIDDIGWIGTEEFLRKQRVVEVKRTAHDNPIALSANGTEIAGIVLGFQFSWIIDADPTFFWTPSRSRTPRNQTA